LTALLVVGRRGPAAKEESQSVSPQPAEAGAPAELEVRLRATHVGIVVKAGEKMESGIGGEIGTTSFAAVFGDGVRLEAELSSPGYTYLVAFNANGKEQLLWPVNEREEDGDESAVPPRLRQFAFPPRPSGLFYLDDDASGGLQVFAVLASSQPLPSYAEWKRQREALPWRKQPARPGVWIADLKWTYPRTKGRPEDRGTVADRPGMPPLTPLARALQRGGVEQVEMLSFPVNAKEAGR
jgi:hypothetical protein